MNVCCGWTPSQARYGVHVAAQTLLFNRCGAALSHALLQVHRAVYKGCFPVAVKMLTDPDLRNPDPDTLRSFR